MGESDPYAFVFLNAVGAVDEDAPSGLPQWRATPDEDEHYTYAIALRS
jgi:hypothetical protein